MEVVVTTGAISHAKLRSKCHHKQSNTQPCLSLCCISTFVQKSNNSGMDNQDDCLDKMTAKVKLNFTSTELTLITDIKVKRG